MLEVKQMNFVKNKRWIFILPMLVILLWSCSTGNKEDTTQKLREKQAQVLEKKKKEVNELIGKMDKVEDSLRAAQLKWEEEKKQVEERLKQIEEKEKQFAQK
jgi:pyruvate/2-oxoacid:ferredoxin oxidoreductase beta subunit